MLKSFSFDVFLSHNHEDKPQVRRLALRLQAQGLRVWFDDWSIQDGEIIALKVDEGLEQSRALLLCLSKHALASGWVGLERSTAIHRDPSNRGRRFLPVLLSDCELPDTLRRYKYVDYRSTSEAAFQKILTVCLTPDSQESRRGTASPHRFDWRKAAVITGVALAITAAVATPLYQNVRQRQAEAHKTQQANSDFARLDVVAINPSPGVTLTSYPRMVTFEWKAVPGAQNYRLEVESKNGANYYPESAFWNFDGAVGKVVDGTSYTATLGGRGEYRWRVTALNRSGASSQAAGWFPLFSEH